MLIDPDLRQRLIESLRWALTKLCSHPTGFDPIIGADDESFIRKTICLLRGLEETIPAPTEQQCKDIAAMMGGTEDMGSEYFHQYNSQGWMKGNGLPITDVKSHMVRWKLKNQETPANAPLRKVTLFPHGGKICGKCGMPAVHKTSGAFDHWYCRDHIPEKAKIKLREQGYDV